MALTAQIEVHNQELIDTQTDLVSWNTQLETQTQYIDVFKKRVSDAEELQEFTKSLYDLVSGSIDTHLREDNVFIGSLRQNIRRMTSLADTSGEKRSLLQHTRERNSAIGRIAELNEKVEKLKNKDAVFTITTKDLRKAIGDMSHVDKNSVSTAITPRGVSVIRWCFKGLSFVPTGNPYPYINGGKPPRVNLQDILVEVSPQTGDIWLRPGGNTSRSSYPYAWSGKNRVHPHILSEDKPCLGDFGGPIQEAIFEKDWKTAAGLIQLFLSSTYHEDSAGKQWYKGVLKREHLNSFQRRRRDSTGLRYATVDALSKDEARYERKVVAYYEDPDNPGSWKHQLFDNFEQYSEMMDNDAARNAFFFGRLSTQELITMQEQAQLQDELFTEAQHIEARLGEYNPDMAVVEHQPEDAPEVQNIEATG